MNRKTNTRNKKPLPKLPEKRSELLRLAVKDARAVAKMKTRRLDMGVFHTVDDSSGRCLRCMAGAVMDRTLRAPARLKRMPDDYDGATADALCQIDVMRVGIMFPYDEAGVLMGARNLIYDAFNERLGRAPWRIYLKAADMLEAAGL